MLFDPGRHEPCCDEAWEAALARDAIRSIVRDLERNCVGERGWRTHPLDDEGDEPRTGYKGLYLGSAGVLWTLWFLHREGAAELSSDPREGMHRAAAEYEGDPDTGEVVPSYFLGRAGILLVLWRMTGVESVLDQLHAAIKSNVANPTNEVLWGAPGTMIAAWHLWEATGESRWRELFRENVEHVWRTWIFDASAGCYLWTQHLYGSVVQYFGAGHGFAGNVYPLLKGAALLDESRRETLYERCIATLGATARFEDDGVNWPGGTYAPRPGSPSMLMQWCHGAPGIVTALADFPAGRYAEMDALLLAAGRAIWKAGPLSKGYGLCHGTAGNGYAFLKLYLRTGDPQWLQRARAFAMHALAQRERMLQQYGRGRYTLWTGDAGLAVYLWHCVLGAAALPALDVVQ